MADMLWELQSLVGDAAEITERALDMAGRFVTDPMTGEELPWEEMRQVADMLGNALAALQVALEPIAPAIKQEQEDMDEGEDRADANRY